ncbi:histidinol-phosphate transaminase [Flavobacteriaceae bacterium F08102]|nr:histidinol-phosphate transaminase [Flavobacteriaceae bacterium F08102]
MKFDLNALVRPNVKGLQPYSSARDEFSASGEAMIFLDANENPFETGLNRYPDPKQRKLKQVLANRHGLKMDQLLLGNGSDEVLDLLFRAFCEPGKDEVIIMPPTYGMYKVLAGINNITCKEVNLSENFELQVDAILAAISPHTKLLFICSPNNPTGNVFSKESIEQLVTKFNGLVVIDEAYIDFVEGQSWLVKLNTYPNLIVTQTLSKAFGLAGIRIGIAYASKEIISILNKIKPPYNVNILSQQKALEVLENPAKIAFEIEQVKKQKEKLMVALKALSFVKAIYPSSTNFILVKVDDANRRYDELLKAGIVIRNRTNQVLCENTLRLTVGTELETNRFIEVLQKMN